MQPRFWQRPRANVWLAVIVISLALLVGGTFVALTGLGSSTVAICKHVHTLQEILYNQIWISQHRLGQKGTAGYAYYHAHPEELAQAKASSIQLLRAINPAKCL